MEDLVFVNNGRPATDSLIVAETFGKSHDKVLRDIRELECSKEFSLSNFGESTYTNDRGREYSKVIMTEQGFTLLVMGYTGKEAMKFKEKYIKKFHEMREKLQQNVVPMDEKQSLIAAMKLSTMVAEETEELKSITAQHSKKLLELDGKIEEQITLDHGEQRRLQKEVAKRVYHFTEDKHEASRLFKELYREIKDRFGVSSYKDVKRKELNQAIQYVGHWIPRKVS
ncbi:antirepressor [Pullulanibacillus camelliae]|uniref:Antirepressor n=1 Tax=Pullulanibacillus camelliae TaxID=1707096 RepID=A0A8J2YK65_9BACL|nr:Rha family transcriptional regulator [Pullulanibacillus camelliae]GGE47956.1 antirepressor [Pullulanibacillus camelliae]